MPRRPKPSAKPSPFPSTKLLPLEFRIFQAWRDGRLKGRRILVACSGGADSVALVHVLARLASRLGFSLAIAHVHHGLAKSKSTQAARARAYVFVARLATELGLEFHSLTPSRLVRGVLRPDLAAIKDRFPRELRSEEELRDFRLRQLERLRAQGGFDCLVFAHHGDDLFETRLIRLIRGTGPQGLAAMTTDSRKVLRPFLQESRESLRDYLRSRKLEWIEDPTNRTIDPLRNWLRHRWLPELEKKRAGGVKAFRRSLELLVEQQGTHQENWMAEILDADANEAPSIKRDLYQRLGKLERHRVLAHYLRHLGIRHFGTSHIEEIAKRLDTNQKVFTFELLRFRWEINAQQILARQA
jgi:tRNA(Ile)-lysidine synthase